MNVSINHPTDKVNFTEVTLGELTVWFSYKTPIAFRVGYGKRVCRENDWGPTTGKHFAYLGSDKSTRIPGATFEALLKAALPGGVDAIA
jgi:hypothetical protein